MGISRELLCAWACRLFCVVAGAEESLVLPAWGALWVGGMENALADPASREELGVREETLSPALPLPLGNTTKPCSCRVMLLLQDSVLSTAGSQMVFGCQETGCQGSSDLGSGSPRNNY